MGLPVEMHSIPECVQEETHHTQQETQIQWEDI